VDFLRGVVLNHVDVIVMGGGASGLMCAGIAGQRGRRVLVLDSSNKVGKKILMSGGGRCNFTNMDVQPEHFLSHNSHFCISALNRYTQWDFLALIAKYNIPYHERKHGQLFCDRSAKDILQLLLDECTLGKVEIRTQCHISRIQTQENAQARFILTTNLGTFCSTSLVVATGGLSIPTMGASGFGYEVAQQFGHTLLPTRAGLVPFMFSDALKPVCERLSGLALDVVMHSESARFAESLLFTHRGMSGPAALQVSNYWHAGEPISIDLFPHMDMADWLKSLKQQHPKSLLRTHFYELMAKNLVLELQALLWPTLADTALANIPDAHLQELAERLQRWTLKPSGTEGYRTAEVTLGGINVDEVSSKTLESKKQAGLYFVGEVLDVTGWLGGYNFQWAWASGHAAGQAV
jgi:predicted Rossmann fold flavoprotein